MLDIEEFKKKLDKKSRLMGIDPGRKRVGIAISDENKIIATPYTTLIKNKYSEFLKEIIKTGKTYINFGQRPMLKVLNKNGQNSENYQKSTWNIFPNF